MRMPDERTPSAPAGVFDRLLGMFTEVHPGEGGRAAVMLLNIFLILACYYIIKTAREPLILVDTVPGWLKAVGVKDTAEVAAYASGGQALALMLFVPAYSWFASRVDHMKLVFGVTAFFVVNILLFALGVQVGISHIGIFFYIWIGLFNMSVVAQFWSYANDTYTKEAGHRLFPVIGVGMTAGAPVGSWLAGRMFDKHTPAYVPLYIAAALLFLTGVLYEVANRRTSLHHSDVASAPIGGKSAFSLVFASRYVGLIALLVVLLNYVNSMGEILLRKQVVIYAAAATRADPSFDQMAFVGGFAGRYTFWVSIVAVLLQAFVAPRLVKRFGLTAVLFALPVIALGAYGLIAAGATFALVRWAKTAENSTDYSIMNNARQLLWLPTTREEKYKAKQAVDTFFVRLGDVAMACVVFAGTKWLARPLDVEGFAAVNVVVIIAWLLVAALVLREHHRLSAEKPAESAVVV